MTSGQNNSPLQGLLIARNAAHVSHIFKLVRDIPPLGDGVKKKQILLRGHKPWRKSFQCSTTLPNRLEMDSRDKIRWIHAAVARQTRNRR